MTEPMLILAGHGGGDDSPANAMLGRLAERVGSRLAACAMAAFNMGTPGYEEAAAHAGCGARVLPVMTSDGFFVRKKITGAIRAGVGDAAVLVDAPIGNDPALRAAAADNALAAINRAGGEAPDLVLVVGHGTRRSRTTSITTRTLAARLSAALDGVRVETAYLDQGPLLEDVASRTRARRIAVVPWLIGGAGHDLEDTFDRVGAPRSSPRETWVEVGGRSVLICRPLADLGEFEDIVVRAGRRAIEQPRLRLGTRPSTLALRQAAIAADALRTACVPVDIVEIETAGDRDRTTPIDALADPDLFTGELERALAAGMIDVAMHSLKDLPQDADPGFALAAMLERGPVEEALVSREGRTLAELPAGAVVGTSSARRRQRVLALRPDLRVAPIRGPVDDRIRQVDEGRFDAAVLALAGLERLGLGHRASEVFHPSVFPYDAGQGVIALQVRAHDERAVSLVSRVDHRGTRRAAEAELAGAREASGERPPPSTLRIDDSGSRGEERVRTSSAATAGLGDRAEAPRV